MCVYLSVNMVEFDSYLHIILYCIFIPNSNRVANVFMCN